MRESGWNKHRREYEEDGLAEDPYVYDQHCDNCGNLSCPMVFPETAEEHYEEYGTVNDFDEEEAQERYEEVINLRVEDAEIRGGKPVWCIYWRQKRGR